MFRWKVIGLGLIAGCTGLNCLCLANDANWPSLKGNNPFVPYKPPEPPPPPKPSPLEFRGVSVEQGTRYFSLYNQETKKSIWLRADQVRDGLKVRSYEPGRGLVVADSSGSVVTLALKDGRISGGGDLSPHPGRPNRAFAQMPTPAAHPTVAMAASAPEAQRLEQVAEQIRLRRLQRHEQSARKT